MNYTYKCGTKGCRKQVTFKKKIEDCIRPKKCEKMNLIKGKLVKCGGNLHRYKRDKIRNKIRGFCHCDGYAFKDAPHRKGTAPWCIHSKREPTQEEYEERYGPC